MHAQRLHRPAPIGERPLVLEEVADPEPGPGELLLAVRACGVCRTDLHVVEGELEPRRLPLVPGHQVVGEVLALGPDPPPDAPAVGERVGIGWVGRTCGTCRFCAAERENLCLAPELTGWTRDGGYAELVASPAAFAHPLPDALDDVAAAPLLCAGIIGYRCLARAGIADWAGARLGIFGFGAAGHLALQLARARGAEVYVLTRDRERHQQLAEELGARWVGDTYAKPPVPLDGAIVFAPAGEVVPAALATLDRGARLVLGGIHMSPVPPLDYTLLYQERELVSVANNTRADARAFLAEAAAAGVATRTRTYPLAEANEALRELAEGAVRGAAVLVP